MVISSRKDRTRCRHRNYFVSSELIPQRFQLAGPDAEVRPSAASKGGSASQPQGGLERPAFPFRSRDTDSKVFRKSATSGEGWALDHAASSTRGKPTRRATT